MRWYRRITAAQRNAFIAAFLGWVLDGFDFAILTFLFADIERSFTVNKALAGALVSVTLFFRLLGGVAAGTAADRWGRKRPLMFSILWYSIFAFLSGFSTSYRMLFALRALFGIGMGGVWAAGMPLAIEHWPSDLRGLASGLLQGGYSVGYVIAAAVYQYVYPAVAARPDFGWRVMLWIGVVPALLVVWIVSAVEESPVWATTTKDTQGTKGERSGIGQLFTIELLPITIQTSLLMGAFAFSYNSISLWYPAFLAAMQRRPLPFIIALHIGGVVGAAVWGRLSETRLGRRGASTLAMSIGLVATPLYLFAASGVMLWAGALIVGLFAAGAWGIVPGYLSERFPTRVRAVGAGLAYHVGAGLGSFNPYLVGALQDRGVALTRAMALCIIVGGLLVILLEWLGPETRGRKLDSR